MGKRALAFLVPIVIILLSCLLAYPAFTGGEATVGMLIGESASDTATLNEPQEN